ncbi:MAG TPA: sigma-70 family RNA polymerase sigma factor [Candidatus Hydrogenedentes bacterium]|nr:sigma-70 family RNA polymerase sigma factor [Candidatus Hydrogenedentota bacterium]
MRPPDAALLDLWLANRDAEAFAEIVSRHAGMVCATCTRILRNAADAEEVAQDCFLKLAQAHSPVRTSLAGWLHTLAVHRSLDRIKADARRRAREIRYVTAASEPSEPGWNDLMPVVDESIAALPEKLRYPIIAHFLEGETHDAIAQTLGVSQSTVTRRIQRGVKETRESLRRRGVTVGVSVLSSLLAANAAEAASPALAGGLGKVAVAGAGATIASNVSGVFSLATYGTRLGGVLIMKKCVIGTAVIIGVLLGALFYMSPKGGRKSQPEISATASPAPETLRERQKSSEPSAATSSPPTMSPSPGEAQRPEKDTEPGKTILPENGKPLERGEIAEPEEFASISGYVTDEQGNPIPDATVIVTASGFRDLEETRQDFYAFLDTKISRRHHFQSKSDGSGAYEISGIFFRGMATLKGYKEGYTMTSERLRRDVPTGKGVKRGGSSGSRPVRVNIEPGDALEDVNIVLSPGVTLTGRVMLSDDTPVVDAVVASLHGAADVAYTDEDGVFQLGFASTGWVPLAVFSEAYGQTTFPGVPIDGTEIIELRMQDTASISGRVTRRDGTPPEGGLVVLLGEWVRRPPSEDGAISGGHSGGGGRAKSYRASVDDEGAYRIDGIDAGLEYRIGVTTAEGSALSPEDTLGVLAPGTTTWDHVIEDAATVRGTVHGLLSHKPLKNVWVSCLKDGLEVAGASTEVSEDGSYDLTLLAGAGVYRVFPYYWPCDRAELAREYGKDIDLKAGEERELDLALPAPYTLSMRVVDEQDKPVELHTVGVQVGHWGSGLFGGTDKEGRFSWSGFPPGVEGSFRCVKPGYYIAETQRYVGEPGEVFPEETVVLYETSE